MFVRRMLQSPRARRGLAASAVVLSLGGLVLFRTPAGADPGHGGEELPLRYAGHFSGPGLEGSLALSQGKVLSDGRVLAELRMRATESGAVARERAPLSLVVVLDTSGSMSGDKIREAQKSVVDLIRQMREDDEVAFVRYDSGAELVQPMARVSDVRSRLIERIQSMESNGGTNIPAGLREGMRALESAGAGRVRRLVLVSDGLDSQRDEAETLARQASDQSTTVSALGIGLDFDESYMSSVARLGRGNFGFVENANALARFLERELSETAATTIERLSARLRLPPGLRLVRALGTEARSVGDGLVEVNVGSLFAGDERRVVLELRAEGDVGEALRFDGELSWNPIGDAQVRVAIEPLQLMVTADPNGVLESRDAVVHARCMSALASARQLDAVGLYARGETAAADKLIEENMADLAQATEGAPAPLASALADQGEAYRGTRDKFKSQAPGSSDGNAAAKRAAEQENKNLDRFAY